jgi:hypothetical protein
MARLFLEAQQGHDEEVRMMLLSVFHKLRRKDVKEDHQWKIVEYLMTECLGFNTAKKKQFKEPHGHLDTVPSWIPGQSKDSLRENNEMKFPQGCDIRCNNKWCMSFWIIGQAKNRRTIEARLLTSLMISWIK